jgi:hypothetical protein
MGTVDDERLPEWTGFADAVHARRPDAEALGRVRTLLSGY